MNLALFDFDGTVTRADTFTPFVYFSASRWRIAFGVVLLAPMVALYKLGWVSSTRMRSAVVRLAFSGRKRAEILAQGALYSRAQIPQVIRPEMLDRIEWHRSQGDTVVIVSASLAAYLAPWCAQLGIELICSELERKGERLTGRYASGDCTAQEKAKRVRARYDLARYSVIYAYGDSPEDRELLELAHERYFRGKPLLAPFIVA
jgi:HAD superfamily hydrolase (TIGR01490 family)